MKPAGLINQLESRIRIYRFRRVFYFYPETRIQMKKTIAVFLLTLLTACAEKPLDAEKAKEVVKQLLEYIDNGAWDKIESLYTAEFNASESVEVKTQKLMRLRDTLGPVKTVEFISATDVAEFGQPRSVVLKYKVIHKRATTIETFTVQEDEGGYKISFHSVETEPLK